MSNRTPEEVVQHVRAGIELLDSRGPNDWRSRIKPEDIDIRDASSCVLFMVFGGYSEGTYALGLASLGAGYDYGFVPDYDNKGIDASLDAEWRKQLSPAAEH